MNRNVFIKVLAVALFLFSCKSSKTTITQVEQTLPKEETKPSIISNELSEVDEIIYVIVEDMPVFNDNTDEEFCYWASSQVIYSMEAQKDNIIGRVFVEFVIDVDGSVINARVIKSVHPLLDTEALRVINLSPKWKKPGYMRGKPVKVKFQCPINFNLYENK